MWVKLRDKLIKKLLKWLGIDDIDFELKAENEPEKPSYDKPEKQNYDEIDYSLLNWKYGGFNATGAAWKEGVIIADLKVNKNRMDYRWVNGNCQALGASSHTDANCICAFFGLVDGKWIGGKFDWISTSRTFRELDHLKGYKGWEWSAYEKATEYAFVITSKDGRLRSNVIKCER